MVRAASDWGGNIAAFGLTIALNAMATSIPLGGQTPPEISAKYPSLFTPAGFTFSIWGVIYLGLVFFIIYQALPAQRGNISTVQTAMGWDNIGTDPITWTYLKLAVAGAIGASVIARKADIAFILVIALKVG